MRSKGWVTLGALAMLVAVAGCDWEAGSSADSTSTRYGAVNFSGIYRASGGAVLISNYTTVDTSTNTVTETIGKTAAGKPVYAGTFGRTPVIASTVQITVGSIVVTDDGSGALAGGGVTGTIIYATGAWSIDLSPVDRSNELTIRATYQYEAAGTPNTPSGTTGVSGRPIFALNVDQQGNNLTISDNNGATYTGKIGSLRDVSGGSLNTPNSSGTLSGEVIADFRASGVSAAGVKVTIVGTLQATAATATDATTGATTTTVSGRKMLGTWIEPNGRTGDINGTAQ